MILRVKRFFEKYFQPVETEVDVEQRLKLATTALLIEMMRADLETSEQEETRLREILATHFKLNHAEIENTLLQASKESNDAADYYRFTSVINEHYSQEQKIQLVEQLWQLAWADGHIDRFEEHLVRTLADLLHVPHVRFIQAKHRVLGTE
jgi:uncharacterized tellurite resistance protein B-like protein